MISQILGTVNHITPTMVTLFTPSGIGYDINISLATYSEIKDKASVLLNTVLIVREDDNILYGFYSIEEKEVFKLLTKVSGVGPATARMVLSYLSPLETRFAIYENNVDAFKKVKGVGVKMADKIIFELKDKVGDMSQYGDAKPLKDDTKQDDSMVVDAIDALVALGFAKKSIEGIVKANAAGCDSVEGLIKMTLKTAR